MTPHGSTPSSSTDLSPDLQLIAPTTTTTVADALSTAPVPARTAESIIRGEFIDLSDLLPEGLGLSPSAAPLQLQLGDRGAVVQMLPDSATSSNRVKRHVHDFAAWMEAWTAYLFVVLSAAPSRAPALVAYQAIITDTNRKFHPDGWLAYDCLFRSAASLNKTLRWDVVEPTLRQPCINCQLHQPTAPWRQRRSRHLHQIGDKPGAEPYASFTLFSHDLCSPEFCVVCRTCGWSY